MHLRSLTLRGFKSFASATTIDLEPGITCVVGPNGSGKSNVVDAIEVFMAFSKWLEYRSQTDPDVTPELMRVINKYQDMYITEQMGIK